jgi:hypothetical protein
MVTLYQILDYLSSLSVQFYMEKLKRSEVRRAIINYLKEFYLDFILYKDLPIINKIYCRVWAEDMYEQFDDKQRIALYLKLIKKTGE